MSTKVRLLVVVGLALALAACIAGSPDSAHSAGGGWILRFFLGLWHGIIAPFMVLGEIINALAPHLLPWKLAMYETKASGLAYDIGFYIGIVGAGPIVIGRRWPRRRL